MPRFDKIRDDEEVYETTGGGGAFNFSAVRPDELSETEYTLVTIMVDVTGSVHPFAADLLQALKTCVGSCKKAPRAENLLVRVAVFNSTAGVVELHGFRHLRDIDADADYPNFQPDGRTPLFDATYDGVGATADYGMRLFDLDYGVNAVVYIITDGDDNHSSATPSMIAARLADVRTGEKLESIQALLVGINTTDPRIVRLLEEFRTTASLDGFLNFGELTEGKLAKLAQWMSRSVSSTSQSLGTGQAAAVPSLTI